MVREKVINRMHCSTCECSCVVSYRRTSNTDLIVPKGLAYTEYIHGLSYSIYMQDGTNRPHYIV